MAKSTGNKQKNLVMRLKQIQGKELIGRIENLDSCQQISYINDLIDSPSKTPMLKGLYFLDKKTLEKNNLPFKENTIPVYLAGKRTNGIIAYIHPNKNTPLQKLFNNLIEIRLNSKLAKKNKYKIPLVS